MFILKMMLLAIVAVTFSTRVNAGVTEKKVRKIHNKILTVDTHCDTPMAILDDNFDIGKRNNPPQSRVDFPRMKEGGLDAIFFAAFTGQRERTPENIENAYKMAKQMIDATYEACRKYNDLAEIAISSKDALRLEKQGKRAIYIGMENGFPIGTDIKRVKEFYDRGVRYITLCHSSNNDICDSSTDRKGPEHNGLSCFGKDVVKEMNSLGMMIDVSHISDKAFYDVIQLSKAPVIASHSSVRSIAHHNRNMTDDMIKTLAKNGGVIQICLLDVYIKDHIDYVKNLVGIDYVGIGSDFDGGGGVDGCADVSEFPNITAEMLERGYTENEIRKVWGGNFFRVFKQVEMLANQQEQNLP